MAFSTTPCVCHTMHIENWIILGAVQLFIVLLTAIGVLIWLRHGAKTRLLEAQEHSDELEQTIEKHQTKIAELTTAAKDAKKSAAKQTKEIKSLTADLAAAQENLVDDTQPPEETEPQAQDENSSQTDEQDKDQVDKEDKEDKEAEEDKENEESAQSEESEESSENNESDANEEAQEQPSTERTEAAFADADEEIAEMKKLLQQFTMESRDMLNCIDQLQKENTALKSAAEAAESAPLPQELKETVNDAVSSAEAETEPAPMVEDSTAEQASEDPQTTPSK